jgi:hypothetical protein
MKKIQQAIGLKSTHHIQKKERQKVSSFLSYEFLEEEILRVLKISLSNINRIKFNVIDFCCCFISFWFSLISAFFPSSYYFLLSFLE